MECRLFKKLQTHTIGFFITFIWVLIIRVGDKSLIQEYGCLVYKPIS
jgi:hypothetical protein